MIKHQWKGIKSFTVSTPASAVWATGWVWAGRKIGDEGTCFPGKGTAIVGSGTRKKSVKNNKCKMRNFH